MHLGALLHPYPWTQLKILFYVYLRPPISCHPRHISLMVNSLRCIQIAKHPCYLQPKTYNAGSVTTYSLLKELNTLGTGSLAEWWDPIPGLFAPESNEYLTPQPPRSLSRNLTSVNLFLVHNYLFKWSL